MQENQNIQKTLLDYDIPCSIFFTKLLSGDKLLDQNQFREEKNKKI